MKKKVILYLLFAVGLMSCLSCSQQTTKKISLKVLKDKIKGGWAGQTISCTYGGPTEFRFRSKRVPDDHKIPWYDGYLKDTYEKGPGLYDDVYMDLTFVQVFQNEGLDAPAASFANAFANADYMLWHANQCARYNILNGVMPPESGYWLNNPCSDDIDFQIEADFAGLMSPGMVATSSEICDKIGHIMNYGDGWYGGVYVAAMYTLAFISDDINYIVEEALKTIPEESLYSQVMHDVIKWHKENPDDWKATWQKVHDKWNKDVGCPHGALTDFNIDSKINSAWILIGLLYGDKDYGKTIDISARCGDDSDCNPASAGGILGAVLGYSNIPDKWKLGLADVEDMDFKYTTMSLNDTYEASYQQALELIKRNGGSVDDENATIKVQKPKTVKLEVGFAGHYPLERKKLDIKLTDEASFEFEGIGFATSGGVRPATKGAAVDHTFEVEMYIDGKLVQTTKLPADYRKRKFIPFWKYQLPMGKHTVRLKVLNPTDEASILIPDAVIYTDKPQ